MSTGPLSGVNILELGGIGPGPYCCMLLADMGADVIRIDRPVPSDLGLPADPRLSLANRSKRSIVIDLQSDAGRSTVKTLIGKADVLVEGFRPGVTERMGIGPAECMALNPRLIYGRMTGWGQDGPLAQAAGHDINYIALSGALHAIGPKGGKPVIPLNLVGDFGGGSLFLALGIVAALHERNRSGLGQVVDAAMVDGVSSLLTSAYASAARGTLSEIRGSNMLDGGAPWYAVYETADGRYVAVGSIEARFYRELLKRTGLEAADLPPQYDESGWPRLEELLTKAFKSRTRDQWCQEMEGSDVCFAPVLSLGEAQAHPHLSARSTLVNVDGVTQPAPAPRFSRTPSEIQSSPAQPGEHTSEVLTEAGFSPREIGELKACRAVL